MFKLKHVTTSQPSSQIYAPSPHKRTQPLNIDLSQKLSKLHNYKGAVGINIGNYCHLAVGPTSWQSPFNCKKDRLLHVTGLAKLLI